MSTVKCDKKNYYYTAGTSDVYIYVMLLELKITKIFHPVIKCFVHIQCVSNCIFWTLYRSDFLFFTLFMQYFGLFYFQALIVN